ncbi:fimbrial biogenesis chaperone [Serratia proteamaculans]|uniref:fimbrial biogenesis chaperone n=1 Tax=Serratia proteamaculans TaxID=28151 RepID=UPI003D02F063
MLLVLSPWGPIAQAGIIASATRVIFHEGDTEKTLMQVNTNSYPVVAQTWVDNGDVNAAPELSRAPFISLPSVFGMQPGVLKGLKIILADVSSPADRESVFWLNLYEVPPSQPLVLPLQSRVTLAMNTQIKIFYRPKNLVGEAKHASDGASFTLAKSTKGYSLVCKNDSAFYLSFAYLSVQLGKRSYPAQLENDMMTAPFSTKDYHIDYIGKIDPPQNVMVNVSVINDQGQQITKQYSATR